MDQLAQLVVGLGNPGSEYEGTRHNVGFQFADLLAEKLSAPPWKSKFGGLLTEVQSASGRIVILKPQTYMNRSGDSVQQVCAFFKLPSEQVAVAHDDLDLALGTLRLKVGGGDGGHNGLKSISSAIGPQYMRLRIGIGRPEAVPEAADRVEPRIVSWVLGRFPASDRQAVAGVLDRAREALALAWSDGLAAAQNRFHRQ